MYIHILEFLYILKNIENVILSLNIPNSILYVLSNYRNFI